MYIVSNRNIQIDAPDDERFGEGYNSEGPTNIRLAIASFRNKKWTVEVMDEPNEITEATELPSERAFVDLQNRASTRKRNCLFYVHGFNNSFKDVLERGRNFEKRYKVEVVCFAWPSNPGGWITDEYQKARAAAEVSAPALSRAFSRMAIYMGKYSTRQCDQHFNLLMHSMGNYLFRNLVQSPIYDGRVLSFTNIIQAAPDVDSIGHEIWVDSIVFCKRLYVTINENDNVLNLSEKINPPRLGATLDQLVGMKPKYMNFTDANYVEGEHAYFEGNPLKNPNVLDFFSRAISGQRAESDEDYNELVNAYMVE